MLASTFETKWNQAGTKLWCFTCDNFSNGRAPARNAENDFNNSTQRKVSGIPYGAQAMEFIDSAACGDIDDFGEERQVKS